MDEMVMKQSVIVKYWVIDSSQNSLNDFYGMYTILLEDGLKSTMSVIFILLKSFSEPVGYYHPGSEL